jgi:hypothetical protein
VVTATVQRGATRPTTVLRVPKRTGSPGDTLIAWGLAILAAEVVKRDVELRDAPDVFEVVVRGAADGLFAACAGFVPSAAVMLPWLASTEKGRQPAGNVAYVVDRDVLRNDYERIRQAGQRPDASGDAASVAAHPLAPKYPLLRVLTNPGTQWAGFNTFVERCAAYWTSSGVEAVLRLFGEEPADRDAAFEEAMRRLGIGTTSDRRRNPPGFLFPGASKGPTMRLDRAGVTVGQSAALDWMLVDRGDLSAIELYLAYVGYFAVATVLGSSGGRVVAVPLPDRVDVPRVLGFLGGLRPRMYEDNDAATVADAGLAYAGVALEYLAEVLAPEAITAPRSTVFRGVQLGFFWMPSGNTYALDHLSVAPLPRWLGPLRREGGFDEARETVRTHRSQIRAVGRAEGGEAREAARRYQEAMGGDALAWLRVMPAWYRAVVAEATVWPWSTREIERIAVMLQPDLSEIIRDPAFQAVTGALRRVTIQAHYAREKRREGFVPDRPGSRVSPQYDLIGTLHEAADRHPDEFLRELCAFVADYNDEAMRRQGPLVRKEDLEQVIGWLRSDKRGLVPALLLAFGVSPRRRAHDAAADETAPGGSGGSEDGEQD